MPPSHAIQSDAAAGTRGVMRRALKNAAWLLGGKGVGGVFSLVYLALLARTLGLGAFGIFATITAYAQAVSNVVSFQSWQTVIRYGARHLAEGRADRMGQILGFTTLLDFGAAAIAALGAAAGALLLGSSFGWTAAQQWIAAGFCLSLFAGQRGTPTGILRLFDRFDLATYGELMVPLTRLLGALAAWLWSGDLTGFLIAWAMSDVVTTLVMWLLAFGELRSRRVAGPRAALGGVCADNPGLWRFSVTTNLSASINLVWQQLPVLAVGWIVGSAAAGGFRMASQLGVALTKPVISLTRAVYPEMAKLTAKAGAAALRPVLRRTALLAGMVGACSVTLVALAGDQMLLLIAGRDYVFAAPIMLVLTVASAINLAGFGIEPALVAAGRPEAALGARAVASVVYVAAMVILLHTLGAIGGAWAALAANICLVSLLQIAFRRVARS
jgi:O-antigen/teichoic acid export membrane protein